MSDLIDAFDGGGRFIGKLGESGFVDAYTPNFHGQLFDSTGTPLGSIDAVTGNFNPPSSSGGPSGGGAGLIGIEAGIAIIAAFVLLALVASPVVFWITGAKIRKSKDKLAGNAFIVAGFIMLGTMTAWFVYDLFRDMYHPIPSPVAHSPTPYLIGLLFTLLVLVHYVSVWITTIATYVMYRRLAYYNQPIFQIMTEEAIQQYRLALFIAVIIGLLTQYFMTFYLGDILMETYAINHAYCTSSARDVWTLFVQSFFC